MGTCCAKESKEMQLDFSMEDDRLQTSENQVHEALNMEEFTKWKKSADYNGYSEALAKQSYLKKEKNWRATGAGGLSASQHAKPRVSRFLGNHIVSTSQKYVKGKELGKGAYGIVSECWLKRAEDGEIFALKTMSKKSEEVQSKHGQKAIIQELSILGKALHPQIVRVYDMFDDNEEYCIVQEMMRGGELKKYAGKLNERQISVIAFQITYALKYCHEMNIVHRDIKAENILMENRVQSGNVHDINAKLADWGLASLFNPKDLGMRDFVGSDDHMAPELIRLWANPDLDAEIKEKESNKEPISEKELSAALTSKENRYNERVDIWAMGIMIYQLFTGYTPFDLGGEYTELHMNILTKDPNFQSSKFKGYEFAVDFIRKCLEKDPSKRMDTSMLINHPWIDQTLNEINNRKSVTSAKEDCKHNLRENMQRLGSKTNMVKPWEQLIMSNLAWMKIKKSEINAATKIFQKADKDKDGTIDKHEFRDGLIKLLGDSLLEDSAAWARLWKKIDTDLSGTLTFNQFMPLCVNFESLVQRKFIKELFSLYDNEGYGKVSTKFLKKLISKDYGKKESSDIQNDKLWAEVEVSLGIKGQDSIDFNTFYAWLDKAAKSK